MADYWLRHPRYHSQQHMERERIIALALVITGFIRCAVWLSLIVMYLVGVPFTAMLFRSVAFVAVISLYANAATDFGQACASLAQFTAGHAHEAAEKAREEVGNGR